MPRGSVKRLKQIDRDEVRKLAAIGATLKMIAEHFGVSHDSIEKHFKTEVTEGRSSGQLRILGRIHQAAMAGQGRALELCAVNICHWRLRPEVNINVLQTGGLSPSEVRTNLLELREAVAAEALRGSVTPIEVEVVRGGPSPDGQTNGQAYLPGQLPAN